MRRTYGLRTRYFAPTGSWMNCQCEITKKTLSEANTGVSNRMLDEPPESDEKML